MQLGGEALSPTATERGTTTKMVVRERCSSTQCFPFRGIKNRSRLCLEDSVLFRLAASSSTLKDLPCLSPPPPLKLPDITRSQQPQVREPRGPSHYRHKGTYVPPTLFSLVFQERTEKEVQNVSR